MSKDRNCVTDQDRYEKIHTLLQETRRELIQDIIAHPLMMPSKMEINSCHSLTNGTLTQHLDKLIDIGVVRRVVVPQGERTRSGPSSYYILSDEGYELLKEHSLILPALGSLRSEYASSDYSDKVQRYESANRPTVSVGYDHPMNGDGMDVVDPIEYVEST